MKPGFQMVPAGPYYAFNSIQRSVNKMYKKSTALLLITLLVASSAAGLGLVSGQPVSTSQQVAETLLNVLGNSHGEVTSLFESVVSGGGTVSEDAQEAYDEAVQLRTQAQEEYDLGEYEEAVKTATKALNMYGKAAGKVFEDEEEDEPEDDDTEEFLGLFVAHERSLERIEKLRKIAEDLTTQGIDVTEATALIDEAQEKLDAMSSALELGEFDSAEDLLGEANSLMGESTGSLQSLSKQKKIEKTEKFIVKTKSMIESLEAKMDRILEKYNLSDEDAAAIREEFQEMKDRLDGIDLDEGEDLNDIIDDLKDIVKDSRDVGDDEDEFDDDVIKSLKEINKQESKLERYRERVEELALLGVDTTGLDALVTGIEEALADALSGTDDGDEDATEDLIDEADDLLDDLDDLIDEVEEEAEDLEEEDEDDEDETDDGEDDSDDLPSEGEDGTGDDEEDDETGNGSDDDNGNGGRDPDDAIESSFDEILVQVNYFIQVIQEKIDVLAELDQDTTDLAEELVELKIWLEDVEDLDELLEIEEEAWFLLAETMSRQGEELDPDFSFIPDDDDHQEEDDHPDDDDDHPDDDDGHS